MSFFDIKNAKERDALVADYLSTMKNIKERNLDEKTKDLTRKNDLKEMFQPVVQSTEESTKAITKELVPLQEEMKILNEKIDLQETPVSENVSKLEDYLNRYDEIQLDKYYGMKLVNSETILMGERQINLDENS